MLWQLLLSRFVHILNKITLTSFSNKHYETIAVTISSAPRIKNHITLFGEKKFFYLFFSGLFSKPLKKPFSMQKSLKKNEPNDLKNFWLDFPDKKVK